MKLIDQARSKFVRAVARYGLIGGSLCDLADPCGLRDHMTRL